MFDLTAFKNGLPAITRNGLAEVKYISTDKFDDNIHYGLSSTGIRMSFDSNGRVDDIDNPFDLVNMKYADPIVLYAVYDAAGSVFHLRPDEMMADDVLLKSFGPCTVVPLVQKLKLARTIN